MIQLEPQVGKNICMLAQACHLYDCCPDRVIRYLREATKEGPAPFQLYEKPLLKVQSIFNESAQHFRKFPLEAREKIYAIFRHRMEYRRYQSMLPPLEHEIGLMEERVANRGSQAREFQNRILSGKGDKLANKLKREQLLSENVEEGVKLDRARILRSEYESCAKFAFNQAVLKRIDLARSCPTLDVEVFKEFEKVIEERERLKALFFHANKWSQILLDSDVQDAFDSILRAAVPRPANLCRWICNLFRALCYSRK